MVLSEISTMLVPTFLRISIMSMKHYDKKKPNKLGRQGLFDLHFEIIVHHWRKSGSERKQGWNLDVGADSEVMEVLFTSFYVFTLDYWLPTWLLLQLLSQYNFLVLSRIRKYSVQNTYTYAVMRCIQQDTGGVSFGNNLDFSFQAVEATRNNDSIFPLTLHLPTDWEWMSPQ